MQWEILAFCVTAVPDVWLKEGQRRERSMWMVSPALCPGQLSYAVSLRGSNLDDLSVFLNSIGRDSVTASQTNGIYTVEAYALLIICVIKSISMHCLFAIT